MYQYWFTSGNKRTTLLKGVNNRGNLGKGEGSMKTLSYFEQFFCKPKTALKSSQLVNCFLI